MFSLLYFTNSWLIDSYLPEAKKIGGLFFDEMATALEKGDRVEIRGPVP